MNRLGYRVTVIEVASGLRKGGTPVDVEGDTIGVLARVGMIDAVRPKALPPRGLGFKDADHSTIRVSLRLKCALSERYRYKIAEACW